MALKKPSNAIGRTRGFTPGGGKKMSAKLPILLHHGLFGIGQFSIGPLSFKYFPGIDRALVNQGHPVFMSTVHPTGSIATRAAQLKRTLLEHSRTLNDGRFV